jgi:hypothetical protein
MHMCISASVHVMSICLLHGSGYVQLHMCLLLCCAVLGNGSGDGWGVVVWRVRQAAGHAQL